MLLGGVEMAPPAVMITDSKSPATTVGECVVSDPAVVLLPLADAARVVFTPLIRTVYVTADAYVPAVPCLTHRFLSFPPRVATT